jgi:hypothetical protein
MLRKRAWGELIGSPTATDRLACIDCGGSIAGCLARLGSLRCHDCREQPGARAASQHRHRATR